MSATIADVLEGRARWCVITGDCLEVLPTLADGAVDAVVTDPPFGVGFAGKATKHTTSDGVGYLSTTDDADTVRVAVDAVGLCCRKFGRCVVVPGSRNWAEYPRPRELGCIFFPSGAGTGPWGFVCSTPIMFYGRDPYLATGRGSRPNSFSTTEATEAGIDHPCPKPIGTMLWLVARASLPGESVLDPFAGSGTTGVACLRLGRRFIGIEKDEKYAQIARDRLTAESQGQSLREFRAGQIPLFGATHD